MNIRFGFLALLLFCTVTLTAHGADNNADLSWRLLADRTAASHDNQYLEAFGNVVLDRGTDYIQADYARYYQATNWVFLQGAVEARLQGDYLKAEEAEFDLTTNTGWLKNGQVFLEDPHMYFSGAILKRTGPETYEFREATVTVCDGDRPAWSIKTDRGDITVDGYAHLWAPRFQVLDQPVLFSPYAVIPVKTKRQSGFLIPEVGVSDRLGLTYGQPYYQVLGDEQDLTVFARYMSRKGMLLGGEYRLVPNIYTKGIFRADYLYDQESEGSSVFRNNQHLSRSNNNRWWVRGKFDGYLFDPAWIIKTDLDLVSDQDYLREFTSGYTGFDQGRRDFLRYFGRDIEDDDSNLRVNRFLLSRNWAHFGFQGLLEYTQNLEYMNSNKEASNNPTLQRLPELNLHLYQTEIPWTPFTAEGSAQLTAFRREYGTEGTRFDMHPLIGWPLHFAYGSIIPKVGFRATAYAIDSYENESLDVATDKNFQNRFVPEFSITGYSEFFKIFNLMDETNLSLENNNSGLLKVKHSIQPRIEYTHTPFVSQSKYPYFDEVDRIEAKDELTYSLTNLFTTKKGTIVPDPAQAGETMLNVAYKDVLRLRLEQSYNFREASRKDDIAKYSRRPFSDLMADMQAPLTSWLTWSSKTWLSPYEGQITEHDHSLYLSYKNKYYGRFGLDFLEKIDEYTRQNQKRQRIARLDGGLRLTSQLSASFLYRADLEASLDLEKRLTLLYQHQCYSVETIWSKTDRDWRFEFWLNLAQLGSMGGR